MRAFERLGFADRVPGLVAAARADAGALPDQIEATAARIAREVAEPDQLVALVHTGRYDEARMVAAALGGDLAADPPEGQLGSADRERLFCLAMLDLRLGLGAGRAARRFAAVRASLPDPAMGPVPELYWAALRGEIEALSVVDAAAAARLRGEVVLRLGDLGDAIPADLRIDGAPA